MICCDTMGLAVKTLTLPTTIPTHLRTKGQNVKLYRVDLMTLKQLEME